jgi:Ca2+-transporting ATPase
MFAVGVFSNRWLLAGVGIMATLQLAFTYVPTMNRMFQSAPIGAIEWCLILGVGALIYGIVGVEKSLRRRGSNARAREI